ncbi:MULTISPECIES: TetR/AcrR family transcriptional regulator [Kribbella]|uniref:TetR family transcriptional regulator n=1 Tax=Kribbella pratensis TaxID=2512112 RepID=A0ABY2FQC7_9ACTN|nr:MULTISPECIES: TetR family transcriptional regulator C-terminal domain-containing protein [Kribbella]TDW94974.1 TetR family transcriptional regulator [Kribbella pratensis]TDX03586.1 TetR family transcriptional regulator [Kribbella sp. VKM Ac-2566]
MAKQDTLDPETRARILDSAATLFYTKGVASTSLNDVQTASGASESQLSGHFRDKTSLIRAVIDVQSRSVLAREESRLAAVSTLAGLRRWRDALVRSNTLQDGSYGCALGAMSTELSDKDERSRAALALAFGSWQQLIVDALERLRDQGILAADVDTHKLGTGLLAALQGGYVLAQNARNSTPMADALDMALDRISSFAESGR